MKIERVKLTESLKKAMSGVEVKKNSDAANAFTFRDGFVHSFRDMIAVSVFLSEDLKELSGTVRASEFFQMVSRLDEAELEIAQGEKDIQITCGRAQASFSLLENSTAVFTDNLDMGGLEWKPASPDFLDGLNYCKLNCQVNYTINGIRVLGKRIVSTDGQRINCFDMKEDMGDWLIEDAAAFELIKLQEIMEYAASPSRVFFRLPNDSVISCRRKMATDYPAERLQAVLDKFVYKEGDFKGTLPAKFKRTLDRAATMAMNWEGAMVVEIRMTKKGIEVATQKESGRFKESIDWENMDEKALGALEKEVDLFVDVSIALYGLNRSSSFFVSRAENGFNKVIFTGENCRCLVATSKKK